MLQQRYASQTEPTYSLGWHGCSLGPRSQTCVTDRADVQPWLAWLQPRPVFTDFGLQPYVAIVCCLMVSTPVIRVFILITTHLPIQEGWKSPFFPIWYLTASAACSDDLDMNFSCVVQIWLLRGYGFVSWPYASAYQQRFPYYRPRTTTSSTAVSISPVVFLWTYLWYL